MVLGMWCLNSKTDDNFDFFLMVLELETQILQMLSKFPISESYPDDKIFVWFLY